MHKRTKQNRWTDTQNKTATIDELVMIDALVDQYFNNKEEINETQTAEFTKID